MVRILQVVGRMDRGGAETLIMNIYRQLDRHHIQFDFAVNSPVEGHYDREIHRLGGRIFTHPSPKAVGLRKYNRAFASTLAKHGPFTGVHSHVQLFSGAILRSAAKNNIPLRIAHGHTIDKQEQKSVGRAAYIWTMRRLIDKNATHIFGCSRAACESLMGQSIWQDSRARVLPNAIDLNQFAAIAEPNALRQKLGLPANATLIGHVGSFQPVKNHKFLVEIFEDLTHQVPDTHLILVGDGPLKSDIQSLIEKAGLADQTSFLGIRDDVPSILGALDLFLFPSLYEGLGIALIEAQAAGIPSVTADTVPDEADVGLGLVTFVDLNETAYFWAKRTTDHLNDQRLTWERRQQATSRCRL